MIQRRTFLKGCGGVVAIPALGSLAPRAVVAGEPTLAPALAVAAPMDGIPLDSALRIDGWDSLASPEGDVWVQINASWRATWR